MAAWDALMHLSPKDFTLNLPIVSLACANLLTIIFAIAGNWDAGSILFIYWMQSVIIGIVTVISILLADNTLFAREYGDHASPAGMIVSRHPVVVWIAKTGIAAFFAFHYGMFHFVYLIFIISGIFGAVDLSDPGIWISGILFFTNHLYSTLYYRKRTGNVESVYATFSATYARIVPMHLALIFGVFLIIALAALGIPSTVPALVILLLLKTAIDIRTHMQKHAGWQNKEEGTVSSA